MENSAQPEEHGSGTTPEDAAEPKRRKVSAAINRTLEAWFRRRELPENQSYFEQPDDEESDDEDTPEHKKKTGKLRRTLRAFFASNVTRQEITSEQPSQPAETTAQELPFDPVVAATFEQQQRGEAADVATLPKVPTPETPEVPTPEIPAPQTPPEVRDLPLTPGGNEMILVNAARSEQAPTAESAPAAEVTKRDLKKVETKRYYGNRHRKRDIRQINRETKALSEQQAKAEDVAENQTKVQQQLRERIAKIEAAYAEQTAERQQKVVKTPEVMPMPTPAVKVEAAPTAERPPESVKEILAKRQPPAEQAASGQMAEQARELARAHYESMQPQAVLDKVEKAAEANVAIEGLFERRHEVKDVDSAQAAGAGSTSTASKPFTLTDAPYVGAPMQAIPPKQRSAKDNMLSYIAPEYKQAARNGFWAAMILMIFVLAMFFIR